MWKILDIPLCEREEKWTLGMILVIAPDLKIRVSQTVEMLILYKEYFVRRLDRLSHQI